MKQTKQQVQQQAGKQLNQTPLRVGGENRGVTSSGGSFSDEGGNRNGGDGGTSLDGDGDRLSTETDTWSSSVFEDNGGAALLVNTETSNSLTTSFIHGDQEEEQEDEGVTGGGNRAEHQHTATFAPLVSQQQQDQQQQQRPQQQRQVCRWPEADTPLVQPGTSTASKVAWAKRFAAGPGGAAVVEALASSSLGGGYARPLFAPGRIVHVRKVENIDNGNSDGGGSQKRSTSNASTSTCCLLGGRKDKRVFVASWVSRDELGCGGSQGLGVRLLFPHAVTDHFPWHIIRALDIAIASTAATDQESFECKN